MVFDTNPMLLFSVRFAPVGHLWLSLLLPSSVSTTVVASSTSICTVSGAATIVSAAAGTFTAAVTSEQAGSLFTSARHCPSSVFPSTQVMCEVPFEVHKTAEPSVWGPRVALAKTS